MISTDDTRPGDHDHHDDDVIVLPWWQNPWNVVAMLVAALALAGGAGFVIGERWATPDWTDTDIGFLHDMRTHHEQAVEMGLLYLGKSGTDPILRLIAKEIAFGQAVEIGRMIQLLRDFGAPEANLTETAMAWMNAAVPTDQMPGLATDADMDRLAQATGAPADQLFVQLMIAHHEGGLHMAEHAEVHAKSEEVRLLAAGIAASQRDEVAELRTFLGQQ